jgi:hypothetical protein
MGVAIAKEGAGVDTSAGMAVLEGYMSRYVDDIL